MSTFNQAATSVSLAAAASLVATTGDKVSYLLMGEPGVGKSAILASIAAKHPHHKPIYIQAQNLDLGDIQMPKMSDTHVSFVPNKAFLPDQPDQPVILMLDELGKAMRPVQNAFLRTLYEHYVGDYKLPNGSIVFATTNLTTDGVGDSMQAHAKNRVCTLLIRKPTADEWVSWGVNHGVAPEVTAWVERTPHVLASYTDADTDNPYIFNPKKAQGAFVSPRTLELASHIVKQRSNFSPDDLVAALSGVVGSSAARDMHAYLLIGDSLPRWERVITEPDTCPLPDSPIAQSILALGALSRVDKPTVTPWMTYMQRMALEVQAMFVAKLMKSAKVPMFVMNKEFTNMCRRNSWMY